MIQLRDELQLIWVNDWQQLVAFGRSVPFALVGGCRRCAAAGLPPGLTFSPRVSAALTDDVVLDHAPEMSDGMVTGGIGVEPDGPERRAH